MNDASLKKYAIPFIKKWWCSLLMLPFMGFSLHQVYLSLRVNVLFSVTYEYPFPLNIVYVLLDNFLLIVHEAGHTFFSITGIRFITILGGSLFQILLPLAIVLLFWINRKPVGLQLSLCMLGYSWFDVAGYAADGNERRLPLIGGLSKESHDWYNLLYQLNWLDNDITIAVVFVVLGVSSYLLAFCIPYWQIRYRQVSFDLIP